MSDQNPPRSADSDPSTAPGGADGGVKSPTDKPDALPGTQRKAKNPVKRLKEVVQGSPTEEVRKDSTEVGPVPTTEGHGQRAAVTLSDERVDTLKDSVRKDVFDSAEAVDHLPRRGVDAERALADAGTHAEALHKIEVEVGTEAFEIGMTVAADKQVDSSEEHARLVRKAAKAAADAPANVRRAHAEAALEKVDEVDSPHGMHALLVDPIRAAEHAHIGDLNVPDVAYGPEGSGAIYGEHNPLARSIIRGLDGDDEAKVRIVAERESKGAAVLDDERREENEKAEKISARTQDASEVRRPRRPRQDG